MATYGVAVDLDCLAAMIEATVMAEFNQGKLKKVSVADFEEAYAGTT